MINDISIIVPVYKVERQLDRCIKSILNQTFTNFELILVDDGSPDNCGKICDEYEKKDSRIKVIHKKNGGLSDARNAGLDIALGKYIGFVDSDDIIHPQMYEKLYNCINKSNLDIVQCKFKKFRNVEELSVNLSDGDSNFKEYNNQEAIIDLIDNNKINVNAWNKLYKRELFQNERYPKGKIHEDEFLTYKLIYNSSKVGYIDEELYYYYENNNGIMNGSNILKRLDRIEALEERNSFFLKNGNKELYNKSNTALFFALNKLYFIFKRNKMLKNDTVHINLLKDKISKTACTLVDNTYLSQKNRTIVNLINKNKVFINIYYIQNWLLSIFYRVRDKVKKYKKN